jgi:AcrR family transcriptional regulator
MIESAELGESNRLFNAIAASIHQHGVHDTTMETIAEKMGTAKSSLYFYGANKDAMLKRLIKSETETILMLCAKRADSGKTLAEQLFILMMVQANYLIIKPDFIPVFNWIRYETIKRKIVPLNDRPDIARILESYRIGELYSDESSGADRMMYAEMTISWASVLSTSTVIFGKKQGLDDVTLRKNICIMFESMMKGDN